MELVFAGLGDNVDGAAGEVRIFHVIGSKFDGGLADGIKRYRQGVASGKRSAVEAKGVGLCDTVNGKGVGAVIAPETGNAVDRVGAIQGNTRIDPDKVPNVAGDRRESLKDFLAERLAGTDGELGYIDPGSGNNDDILVRTRRECKCKLLVALQIQELVLDRLAFKAGSGCGDAVGSARHERTDIELPVCAASGILRLAGSCIRDRNGSICQRVTAVIADGALYPRCDLLSSRWCCHQAGGGKADNAGSQKILDFHDLISPFMNQY